ncbi:unnamed protein product [Arabis nemorensis]|uniref:DUF7086 domain-containing protein n=1 Tax=Arabis nemorensis TaxID=586526 RepID=A0A565CBC4_9BRAS|nr:unnamed protein product [Arabis nemorensis]
MSDENKPEHRINLDLSLGLPVEDLVENPVEEPSFMQLLRSESDSPPNIQPPPPPLHHMTPPGYYTNVITPWNISPMPALPLPPPPGVVSVVTPSPYPPSGQVLQPPQQIQDGVGALRNPRPGPRLGRPPAGRNSSRSVAVERNGIVPPYPWATSKLAVVHNYRYLSSNNINVISGQVQCRPCEKIQTLEYNLKEKFMELYLYISNNNEELRNRAPKIWTSPKLTLCGSCESPMKPVISEKKEEINWLFLFLGQMLGSCTLEQLKYFCDKTSQHQTGSKEHLLYQTYLGLFKQLVPSGSFSL